MKWLSPIGNLYLYADEMNLLSLLFEGDSVDFLRHYKTYTLIHETNPVIELAIAQLQQYFTGDRKDFDLPILLSGTDFQKKVWAELARIPFGKTISYGEQAKNIKAEKAVRAVGTANSKNPLAIIIPCHRVISATGKIGGYAGGIAMKTKLLALEGIKI
ncbi:MAG: methylated-DNA--[protein]-cysteine S-methyltransferase [Bdellovibrio sp.]|nr:methylated-DNA--[protein]-cysteine S-methyltransferase [Bdellovibrio sp.]